MPDKYSNGDKLLQAVLSDPKLSALGEYTSTGTETIDDCLNSDNYYIKAVALFIRGVEENRWIKEVYNEVSHFLGDNL